MDIKDYTDSENRIYVCWADISEINADSAPELMSEYRLERLGRIKNTAAAGQSVGAELMLVHAVKKCIPGAAVPVEYRADDRGKPYFPNTDAYFSLSHSGRLAVCVISDMPVGVDVQKEREVNARLADKYFTEEERGMACDSGGFTRIWARKEAAAKADGAGLAVGLAGLDVSGDIVTLNGRHYTVMDIDTGIIGYRMAAAVQI